MGASAHPEGEAMAKKILIVEDERVVADDVQKSLKDMGYDAPYVVSSGEKAIEITQKENPDLVLMDIVLQGSVNGIEAADHIRSGFNIPVVFLTAYADEKTLRQARMAEPYGYLVKPFKDTELHATIEMALHKHEREKRTKENTQQLEKEIEGRSKRIEVLLNTNRCLQEESRWEKGLNIIVEGMCKLGFDRAGVFLIDSRRKKLDFHFGEGFDLPGSVLSISLTEKEYFGVQCVVEKKTIHVRDSQLVEGKQITESASFVWVPIVVQNEAFAALSAGNVSSENPVTEEDVKDLEILSGMCGAFIDRTRISVEPAAENVLKSACKCWLDPSGCYIAIEKKPEKVFEIFCDLVTHGIPGFVISREYPKKLRRAYNLVKTPILWLSRSEMENVIGPDDLSKLNYVVADFTRKSAESVVLLDGLEYLVMQTGFHTALHYIHQLKDVIVMNNSRLLIPLHKDTLSLKEYSILEKEFTIL